MFLLRCAFFLSIVYASIFWHHGAFTWKDGGARAVETARADAQALIAKAAVGASTLCSAHPRECLADAARLTSLFHAGEPAEGPSSRERELSQAEAPVEDRVPLPVPDPRRHNMDAKLARVP